MKREEIKKLTLSGILTALTIIIFTMGVFIPFFNIVIILCIPFASALINLKTDIKYSLIYILSSVLISSLINFQDALFYMIPGLIIGLFFGIFIKRNIHSLIYISLTSIISIILQLLSIELINVIYNIDFLTTLSIFFKIEADIINNIQYLMLFLIGLIQNILVFFLLENELPKFNYNINSDYSLYYPLLVSTIICASLGILLNNIVPPISYLLSGISLFTLSNLIIYFLKSDCKWMSYAFTLIIAINFFLFITLNNYLENNGYYLFFNIITLSISLIGVILIIEKVWIKKLRLNNNFFINNKSFLDYKEEDNG